MWTMGIIFRNILYTDEKPIEFRMTKLRVTYRRIIN